MKIKLFFLLLFLNTGINISFAQMTKVKEGSTIDLTKKSNIKQWLLHNDSNYYVIESQIKRNILKETSEGIYFIHRFNKELNHEQTKMTKVPFRSDRSKIEYSYLFGNELLIFASEKEGKKGKTFLYIYRYNPTTLEEIGDKKIAIESDLKSYEQNSLKYVIRISKDKSKLLTFEKNKIDKRNKIVHFTVFEKNVKKLWQGKYLVNSKGMKDAEIKEGVVDNNGNVILLRQDRLKNRKTNYSIVTGIFSTNNFEKNLIEKETDEIISRITMRVNKDQSILVTGYYGLKDGKYTDGIFYTNWVQNKSKPKFKFLPFSKEFRVDAKKELLAKKRMMYYFLRNIYINDKNNLIITGERRNPILNGTHDQKRWVSFEYTNIIYSEINMETGQKIREGFIKKKQEIKEKVSRNFYFQEKGDDLYFIFNDHPKNRTSDKKKARSAYGLVSTVKVGSDNNQSYSTFPEDDNKINVRGISKLSNNEIIRIKVDDKKLSLIKYEF